MCIRKIIHCLATLFFLAGCSVPLADLPQGADHEITIVDFGLHTVIVLEGEPLAAQMAPYDNLVAALENHPDAPFYEFGWGDAKVFADTRTLSDLRITDALRAALWPTPALVQIVPRFNRPGAIYSGDQARLTLSDAQFKALLEGLNENFSPPVIGRKGGLEPDGLFYPAQEQYHAFRNCNSWTAERLRQAGVPAPGGWVVSSSRLVKRLKDGVL